MNPRTRLWLACLLFSSWLILLLVGLVFGGLAHLLLAAGLLLFPRSAGAADDGGEP